MDKLFRAFRDATLALAWLALMLAIFFAGIGVSFGILYRFFRWVSGL